MPILSTRILIAKFLIFSRCKTCSQNNSERAQGRNLPNVGVVGQSLSVAGNVPVEGDASGEGARLRAALPGMEGAGARDAHVAAGVAVG